MKKNIRKIIFTFLLILILILVSVKYREVKALAPFGNYLELYGGYLLTEADFAKPTSFSFEAWILPQSASGIQKILSIGDKTKKQFHYEVGINGGSLQFNYRFGTNSQKYITAGHISPNIWTHIGVTVDKSSSKIFLNGQVAYSTAGEEGLFSIGPNIVIGRSYNETSTSEIFQGGIDEVRISDTVRNISFLWSNGTYENSLINDENTLILWHFDENRGQIQAMDSSGNGKTGILVGGDGKIHFSGLAPSPTPFIFPLPTIRFLRPTMPVFISPIPTNIPEIKNTPTPTSYDLRYPRPTRSTSRIY